MFKHSEASQDIAVTRWSATGIEIGDDCIAAEVPIALVYNGIAHAVMMATPGDLEDFALGFSLSEGILRAPAELYATEMRIVENGIEVDLTIAAERFAQLKEMHRSRIGRTGCGLCGIEALDQLVIDPPAVAFSRTFAHAAIQRALHDLSNHQPLQRATGAVHAAAWCSVDGNVVIVREDVGRHNALDKLLGAMTRESIDKNRGFVLISSRASYEMVAKAALLGVQLIVAISAPTGFAIALAERAGITLTAFARGGRHSVYSHPQRLIDAGS